MVERLCVPLTHSTVERHLNLAASGAFLSASCAPNSASTLTPLFTGLASLAVAMTSSWKGSTMKSRAAPGCAALEVPAERTHCG
jgi:hypothetical protein